MISIYLTLQIFFCQRVNKVLENSPKRFQRRELSVQFGSAIVARTADSVTIPVLETECDGSHASLSSVFRTRSCLIGGPWSPALVAGC